MAALRCRQFSDLPVEVQRIWHENYSELVRAFAQKHKGQPWLLRCRQHSVQAYVYVEDTTGPVIIDEEGRPLNFSDLISLPCYLVPTGFGGPGNPGPTLCLICNTGMDLFNPMLEVLEEAEPLWRLADDLNLDIEFEDLYLTHRQLNSASQMLERGKSLKNSWLAIIPVLVGQKRK